MKLGRLLPAAATAAILVALGPGAGAGVAAAGAAAAGGAGEGPSPTAAAGAAAEAASRPAPPAPDLAGVEPAVAVALGAARDDVVALLAEPDAPAAALAEVWGDLGRLYHAYGLVEAAAECYREAAARAPGDLRWVYLLGHAERARGDLAAAREAFVAALRLDAYAPIRIALAEIELLEGRPAEAAAAAEEALLLVPGEPAALAALGQAKLDGGDPRAAVAAFEAALAAVPAADRLHYPLGLALRALGDEARAREHLGRAGRTGVRPADPLLAAVEASRGGEIAATLRGRRAALAGDWPAAAAAFSAAVAANPDSAPARVNLAAALASTGDLAGAREQLETVLARDPGHANARYNLGALLLFAGEAAAAEPHLRAAVAARADDADARRGLGEVLLEAGRVGEALPHLEQAVLLAPGDEEARFHEAVALLRLGSWRLARERLEDGLRQLPDSGRLAHLLARLLAAAPDLALRDGERAVDLAGRVWAALPSLPHGRTLAQALAEAGRCEEAAALARRLAAEHRDAAAELEALAAGYAAGPPCRPAAEGGTPVAAPVP